MKRSLIAALALLSACSKTPVEDPMTPLQAPSARPGAPPIDLERPAVVKTATFALG